MHVQFPIKAQGRFGIIKHTGHKYDSDGRLLELGRELESTPLADNYFTKIGSAFWASHGPNNVSVGLSSSGSPPEVSGVGVIFRTSSNLVSSTTTRSLVPDSNGKVWWRKIYRFTFPATAGLPVAIIRQASASVTGGPLAGGVTSGVVSAALLEGPAGGFTEVRLDQAAEPLDVIWDYTEYFNPEISGFVTVKVVDGLGLILGSSVHSYVIRPANLNNTSDSSKGWQALADRLFPSLTVSTGSVQIGLGNIEFTGSQPVFIESLNPSEVNSPDALVGMPEYVIKARLGFDDNTSTNQIDCAQFMLGHTEWQIQFDPPISKQSRHIATFSIGLIAR